jgi:hypothetical protein
MIDLTTEDPLPLAAAVKLVPPARMGKRTHFSTVLRWILTGCKAPDGTVVKLDAVRLGNRWMTSRQAIQRFALALTPRQNTEPALAPRSPGRRQRAHERAAKELESAGI